MPRFPVIAGDVTVDVAVIGGGMTGITAAYLLKKAGRQVALLERGRCAMQDTGQTTAHLTYVTDRRLHQLVKTFGRDHAGAAWDAGFAAMQQIHSLIQAEQIACDFNWVPGYLHAPLNGAAAGASDADGLQRDAELAQEMGIEAEYLAEVPLFGRPGVRFPNQAMFHPLKYLAHLLQRIPGEGSHVFENSEVQTLERVERSDANASDSIVIASGDHRVTCAYVVIATNVPLAGLSNLASAAALQTKLAPYTSYAIGARLPAGLAPHACFWDTSDPYYYLRVSPEGAHDYAVFGGRDHKTGQVEDTQTRFDELERTLRGYFPGADIDRRWSGQVIESHDGLPLIGETTPGQFVATGYSGNGMSFGTLAAMMACDAVCGCTNPWSALFSPSRTTFKGGTWNYVRENADYPYYMLKDRIARGESQTLEDLEPGAGQILKLDGRRVAAYRNIGGNVTLLSPVCPHLGCIVHWNEAEATWDCPCHGSRFRCTGEVLAGPAEKPLAPANEAVLAR